MPEAPLVRVEAGLEGARFAAELAALLAGFGAGLAELRLPPPVIATSGLSVPCRTSWDASSPLPRYPERAFSEQGKALASGRVARNGVGP
jgi:hypothetical protein